MIKILFLAANPSGTSPLRLDKESSAIDEALQKSEFRDKFDVEQHWAVSVSDLQGLLLRHKPDIIHFSGHGNDASEIILEDDAGNSHPVPIKALGQLFSLLKDNVRCVVLNACYSKEQAEAIAEYIDCVIVMADAIGDSTSISFAKAFYQALGYGKDIITAFELGRTEINLENLGEHNIPHLLTKGAESGSISFFEPDDIKLGSTERDDGLTPEEEFTRTQKSRGCYLDFGRGALVLAVSLSLILVVIEYSSMIDKLETLVGIMPTSTPTPIPTFTSTPTPTSTLIPTPTLMPHEAYWQFEDSSGLTVSDSSGNGNTGTLEGGASWGRGIVGGGLMLDGKDDQVRIPDSPSISIVGAGLTLEAWVKPDTVNNIQTLIHKEGQYSLRLDKEKLTYADSITWNYGKIGYYGNMPAGVWSHLAVTFDGNNVHFYINGALVGTKARAGNLSDNEQPVCLGSYNCGIEGTWFKGGIDEVAIYQYPLLADDIQRHYQAGRL